MRKAALLLVLFLFSAITVSAQSVDEIIGRYLKSIGGSESVALTAGHWSRVTLSRFLNICTGM